MSRLVNRSELPTRKTTNFDGMLAPPDLLAAEREVDLVRFAQLSAVRI